MNAKYTVSVPYGDLIKLNANNNVYGGYIVCFRPLWEYQRHRLKYLKSSFQPKALINYTIQERRCQILFSEKLILQRPNSYFVPFETVIFLI